MNGLIPAQADQLVSLTGDHPTTNTLIIAEHFGKEHKHVMRDVRELLEECGEEFGRSNFGQSSYYNDQGKKQPMYEVTRDGFMLLAMGFTGANATRLKIAFIGEFNRMEAALHIRETALITAARTELLRANPLWKAIARYADMGLTAAEIARLTGYGKETLRRTRRRMEACGVLQPPANLAKMQQLALPLVMKGVKHVH